MITIHELLEDKVYTKFFLQKPVIPGHVRRATPRWRVYVQRETDGPWGKKDLNTYTEAFKFFKSRLRRCHDAAIHCRGFSFDPPSRIVKLTRGGLPVMGVTPDGVEYQKTKLIVWKPKLYSEDMPHTWCVYCRRPVELRWFTKHHNFGKKEFDASLKRCPICGTSERLLSGRK